MIKNVRFKTCFKTYKILPNILLSEGGKYHFRDFNFKKFPWVKKNFHRPPLQMRTHNVD